MERLEHANAGFRSLTESVDTTTSAGRMLMQMVGSFAEFERLDYSPGSSEFDHFQPAFRLRLVN